MCTALEEMIKAGEMRGRAEGKAEGRAEGLIEGCAKGKAESILELLEDLSPVPAIIQKRIMAEKNLEILKRWHKQAAKAESIEQFQAAMN